MRKTVIDVRGLACPEPLFAFTEAAKNTAITEIDITFDCAAARDNITRAADKMGWNIASVTDAPEYTRMSLVKAS